MPVCLVSKADYFKLYISFCEYAWRFSAIVTRENMFVTSCFPFCTQNPLLKKAPFASKFIPLFETITSP